MKRGEPKYLVITKQTDQTNELDQAPISLIFNTIDDLQRGLIGLQDLDKYVVVEAHPLAVRVETKVVIG